MRSQIHGGRQKVLHASLSRLPLASAPFSPSDPPPRAPRGVCDYVHGRVFFCCGWWVGGWVVSVAVCGRYCDWLCKHALNFVSHTYLFA